MIEKVIRVLQFLRVCDEQGQLSITTAAFVIGCICVLGGRPVSLPELSAFALALGGYHLKKSREHARATQAMATAHAAGMAKLDADKAITLQKESDQAEQLGDRLTAIERKVTDLATPQQMEQLRQFLRRGT